MKMYVGQVMTQREIAKALGVSVKRVETAMRRFQIPRRKAAKRFQGGRLNCWWKGKSARATKPSIFGCKH